MIKEDFDLKKLKEIIAENVIYFSSISSCEITDNISIDIEKGEKNE